MNSDTDRLVTMAKLEKTLCLDNGTYLDLFRFVDIFCFKNWVHRSRFISVDDFLNALRFDDLVRQAAYDLEAHLMLVELIYNFWNLANNVLSDKNSKINVYWCGNFYHIKAAMDDILEECNHIAWSNDDNDCIIVVENKPEVTAAAEIMPTPELSFDIIRYNHRALKGDVKAKKAILITLEADLEAKRKELQAINNKLSDDVFFMLNNINIRHNNCSKQDSAKYKKYVADMAPEQLEEWYDELYQMMLLGFLLLDNKERSIKIGKLKDNINRG